MDNLLYGTDPEFFSVYGDNFVVSPALLDELGIIKPVKRDTKHPVYIDKYEFLWMMDGVAWEVTFKKPFTDSKIMFAMIKNSLDCLENFVTSLEFRGEKLKLYKKPVVNIDTELYLPLLDISDKIYQGFIFGCDPDKDAFEVNYRCKTVDVTTHKFRYGGGHLHTSTQAYFYNCIPLIKAMAITVGNYCIANSVHPLEDKQRVFTYGRPGRYRGTNYYTGGYYGVEYRTPSNSWTSFDESKFEGLVYWLNKAWEIYRKTGIYDNGGENIIREYSNPTVNAINNFDQEESQKILDSLQGVI